MESEAEILFRVRRRIIGAKSRHKESWEDLFSLADKDRSKTLDFRELRYCIRASLGLNISKSSLVDHDLKVFFEALDTDRSGTIDLAELLEYISHGQKRPEDEEVLQQKRTERVQRNLRLASRKLDSSEAGMRSLFDSLDHDRGGRLCLSEFSSFVRQELQLGPWDLMTSEVKSFYRSLDKDGDGIDIHELMGYVHGNHAKNVGDEDEQLGFRISSVSGRKRPTFKQQLLEGEKRPSSVSSSTSMGSTCSFVNLGRTRAPMIRASSTGSLRPKDLKQMACFGMKLRTMGKGF
ncbi:unnamed protein product [Polarella glacialis]|uniref:EF-hand domain-containing protein n=1 Tax=Polarella glacialis TaxID=89957 RepID=A0A813H985_POLGL|nr:unnamed protein product [Polarella glacialis]